MEAKKIFYGLIGGIVLTIGGIGYGLYWANTQLKTRSAEISQLNAQAETLDKQILNAKQLESELKQYDELREIAAGVLPEAKTQENIVGEILSIAAGLGIELEGINFTGGGGDGKTAPEVTQADEVDGLRGVYGILLNTSFVSSYDNIQALLQGLENNKRRFDVQDVSISPIVDPDAGVVGYTAQFNILTYVKP